MTESPAPTTDAGPTGDVLDTSPTTPQAVAADVEASPGPFMPYVMQWDSGASATVDIEADTTEESRYRLRFASPHRSTIREASQQLLSSREDLDELPRQLGQIAAERGLVTRGGSSATGGAGDATMAELVDLGRSLLEHTLPPSAVTDLGDEPVYIELGTDESLVHLPWELLHDGDDFLALKHYLGRFVIQSQPSPATVPARELLHDLDRLNALVICVPKPDRREDGSTLPYLAAAHQERDAVVETLLDAGVRVQLVDDPTRANVRRALREPHEIVHFTGHAVASAADPRRNALVLQDGDLNVGQLSATLRFHRAVLCFVNGCETSRGSASGSTGDFGWDEQFAVFGLARAFLESGAYVLGTRWKLPDDSGSEFARTFYRQFLGQGLPIGKAIAQARVALKEASPNDLSWASYVYWGDPRIALRPACRTASVTSGSDAGGTAGPRPGPGPGGDGTGEEPAAAPPQAAVATAVAEVPAVLQEQAQAYEAVRTSQPSSWQRTARLSSLVGEAARWGAHQDVSPVTATLVRQDGDGARVVALALLQARPDPARTPFLLDVVTRPRSAFEQYQALQALKRLGPLIPDADREAVVDALEAVCADEAVIGSDRYVLAQDLLARLGAL